MNDQERISPYSINTFVEPTSDKNNEKNQIGDYWLIQCKIFRTTIIRIVWQTVRRITNEILGVIGLKFW